MRLKNDIKIPFVERTIPAGSFVKVVGTFSAEKDKKLVKIKVLGVPGKHGIKTPVVKKEDAYGVLLKDLVEA